MGRKVRKDVIKSIVERTEDYLEVEKFIYEIKRKAFRADYVDLFRLVHVYDLAFPKLIFIPMMCNIEKSCQTMFYKICCWYIDQKQKREEFNI